MTHLKGWRMMMGRFNVQVKESQISNGWVYTFKFTQQDFKRLRGPKQLKEVNCGNFEALPRCKLIAL